MSLLSKMIQFFVAMIMMTLPVRAEGASCRYDPEKCSCIYQDTGTAVCWDRVSGTPTSGSCQSRTCGSGWTCSCQGRTHLCNIKETPIIVVDKITGPNTALCHEDVADRAAGPILELGEWLLSLSRKGFSANACGQISLFHNGEALAEFTNNTVITPANVDDEFDKRTMHEHVELQTGDLLAFRFKDASYYCYNSLSGFTVNGNVLDTTTVGIKSHYATKYSPGWHLPSFTPTYSAQEAGSTPGDFIPLRTKMISGTPISPGDDVWKDEDSYDHHKSNYYFRIQL